MKDIDWLGKLFPFVRFCSSPTEKRAEHNIRQFKYGVAKDEGHTRGRWYAKHEAWRSVRNKENGDFVEPELSAQRIIQDDLSDVDKYNNELHPLQKTYPGMTRRQVLIANANPHLQPVERWHLYRFIGNTAKTSIRNNDYCQVANGEFDIVDFHCLKRLKPNDYSVMAYWLPSGDGSVERVYLYQGDTYIGEAINRSATDYNECHAEQTAADEAKMLEQNKRVAKFDKFVKESRAGIPVVGRQPAAVSRMIEAVEVEIVETVQPAGVDEDYGDVIGRDWGKYAVEMQ
jgi:hypothetical protein